MKGRSESSPPLERGLQDKGGTPMVLIPSGNGWRRCHRLMTADQIRLGLKQGGPI